LDATNTHDAARQRQITGSRHGKYHFMEERLAFRIRLYRGTGFVFETWMMAIEGRELLRELYRNFD